MNTRRRQSRWVAALLGTVALAVTVTGCGPAHGSAGDAAAGPTGRAKQGRGAVPSSSPSAFGLPSPWDAQSGTAAQQAAATLAMAAYRGMWADLKTLSATLDGYRNPQLGAHMTGQPLHDWSQSIADDAGRGTISAGAPQLDPRVVKVGPGANPTQVEIADCFDNTGWPIVNTRTHKPTDSTPGVRERTEALVERQFDGYWRVSQQVFAKAGTC